MRRGHAAAAFLAFIAGGAPCAPAHAGAWTLEPGELKLFLLGHTSLGQEHFDRRGKRQPRGLYAKSDLQAYAEYGVRDGLTAFGSTGYQRIDVEDLGARRRKGLGRSELGLRARLWTDGAWIVSAQASAVMAGARRKDGLAAIGETDDQLDARGLVARSFTLFNRQAFVDFAAGYRFRSGDPADEARFDATFGVRTSPRLLLLAQSFNQIGLGRWRGPLALKQRIHKLQIATLFDLTDRLQLISAAFVSPAGRDSVDERGGTIGIGVKF